MQRLGLGLGWVDRPGFWGRGGRFLIQRPSIHMRRFSLWNAEGGRKGEREGGRESAFRVTGLWGEHGNREMCWKRS